MSVPSELCVRYTQEPAGYTVVLPTGMVKLSVPKTVLAAVIISVVFENSTATLLELRDVVMPVSVESCRSINFEPVRFNVTLFLPRKSRVTLGVRVTFA